MSDLVKYGNVELTEAKREEIAAARVTAEKLGEQARADSTNRAYTVDWQQFETWAISCGMNHLPASSETMRTWIGHLENIGAKPKTIARKVAAVSMKHREADLPSPRDHFEVRKLLKGLAKKAEPKKSKPVMRVNLPGIVEHFTDSLRDVRDRAIILVGWVGALRREEIVELNYEAITFLSNNRIRLLIARSKTDQMGEGQYVGLFPSKNLDICPVTALNAWLERSGIRSGPIFVQLSRHDSKKPAKILEKPLHPKAVRTIMQRVAGKDFTAHSLRRGFTTQSARDGKKPWEIMRQTRHRSIATVQGYIEAEEVMKNNAAEGLLDVVES